MNLSEYLISTGVSTNRVKKFWQLKLIISNLENKKEHEEKVPISLRKMVQTFPGVFKHRSVTLRCYFKQVLSTKIDSVVSAPWLSPVRKI